MKKRVFLGIEPSFLLKRKILSFEQKYLDFPVRWIKEKNLHVTVVPPWYEEDIASVAEQLRQLQGRIKPFTLEFRRVTFGPTRHIPRLIWAEAGTSKQLLSLKRETEELLQKMPEKRPFLTHLTLARFPREKLAALPVQSLQEDIFWEETVEALSLFEAKLYRTGAEYDILLQIPFVKK